MSTSDRVETCNLGTRKREDQIAGTGEMEDWEVLALSLFSMTL